MRRGSTGSRWLARGRVEDLGWMHLTAPGSPLDTASNTIYGIDTDNNNAHCPSNQCALSPHPLLLLDTFDFHLLYLPTLTTKDVLIVFLIVLNLLLQISLA